MKFSQIQCSKITEAKKGHGNDKLGCPKDLSNVVLFILDGYKLIHILYIHEV